MWEKYRGLMKYTPITITKREKNHKTKDGTIKKYTYYEALCTVQLGSSSYRETGSGKTRKGAKEALLKKLDIAEKQNSTTVSVKSEKLIDALEHFIEYKLAEGWKQSTYYRDKTIIKNQIEKYPIGQKHPLEVSHQDILEHLEKLREKGYKLSTLDKTYSLLQLYFGYVYQDHRFNNPCYDIHLGYAPKLDESQVLNTDEVVALFKACDEMGGNADLIKFIVMTYERSGEASTLKFSDWNKNDKTLRITRTATVDRNGRAVVGDDGKPKTQSSNRVIKLSDMANEIIKIRYTNRQKELTKRPGTAYIWTQKRDTGKYIDYNTVRRLLIKALEIAQIDKHITLHGLRHSGITFYGKDKNAFLAISKNAGHSRPSITEDIYSHLLDEQRIAAVASADELNKVFNNLQQTQPLINEKDI